MNKQIPNVPIAFFDLDETLINKETNTLWLEWRMRKDIRGIFELLIGLHNSYYYKRGKLTDRKMKRYFNARTVGIDPDTYKKMADIFFKEKGKLHIYPEAIKLIEDHKKKGIQTAMGKEKLF